MKTLHFADSHFGVTTNGAGNDRVHDFLDTLDWIIDYIEKNQVDLVLFAGDLFDKHTQDANLLKEVFVRLQEISDIATLVMVPGNHDMKMVGVNDTAVGLFSELDIENIYATDAPRVIDIDTTGGRAIVAMMPYPRFKSHVHIKSDDTDELQHMFDLSVAETIELLADQTEELKLQGEECPCFLIGHFTVTGCDFGAGRIAWGNESYVNPQQFKNGPWDYVALGHIHKHQVLVENPPVVYSGSMDRTDFGEQDDDKGFTIIESVGPAITWKFVPVPVRPMVTYQYDLRGEPDPQRKLISNLEHESLLEDSIVRVRVFTDHGVDINLRNVRKVLNGVHYVANIIVERDKPEREGRIEELDFDTRDLSEIEWLEIYYHGIGLPIEERDVMHSLFDEITEDA